MSGLTGRPLRSRTRAGPWADAPPVTNNSRARVRKTMAVGACLLAAGGRGLHIHFEVRGRPAALKAAAADARRVVALDANHVLARQRERGGRGCLALLDRGRGICERDRARAAVLAQRRAQPLP